MRPHLKATQERQWHEAALPPAQCSQNGGHSPAPCPQPILYRRYSLSSLLPALSGKVRYEELIFLTRGSRMLGSMAVPQPVPVWVLLCLGPDAWGCLGEEEAAESERGEAALHYLIREICASWAHACPASGEETGGAGKPAGKGTWENDGDPQPLPCACPDPISTKPTTDSGTYRDNVCRTVSTSRNFPLLRPLLSRNWYQLDWPNAAPFYKGKLHLCEPPQPP